jgi:hypothetical protein
MTKNVDEHQRLLVVMSKCDDVSIPLESYSSIIQQAHTFLELQPHNGADLSDGHDGLGRHGDRRHGIASHHGDQIQG